MKNQLAIIPIVTGGVAVFAWILFFIARGVIDRWEAGGKKDHIHLAWQMLYDRWGRDGIVYFHFGFALLMTIVCGLAAWRVITLR